MIFALQIASLSGVWFVVIGITALCVHLISKASVLKDGFDASIAISVIAICVFWALGSLLTYVFVGLHRKHGKKES